MKQRLPSIPQHPFGSSNVLPRAAAAYPCPILAVAPRAAAAAAAAAIRFRVHAPGLGISTTLSSRSSLLLLEVGSSAPHIELDRARPSQPLDVHDRQQTTSPHHRSQRSSRVLMVVCTSAVRVEALPRSSSSLSMSYPSSSPSRSSSSIAYPFLSPPGNRAREGAKGKDFLLPPLTTTPGACCLETFSPPRVM